MASKKEDAFAIVPSGVQSLMTGVSYFVVRNGGDRACRVVYTDGTYSTGFLSESVHSAAKAYSDYQTIDNAPFADDPPIFAMVSEVQSTAMDNMQMAAYHQRGYTSSQKESD